MRLLIVTEKCGPEEAQRDGGARLVASLRRAFGDAAAVAQFGDQADSGATWHFTYPPSEGNRFTRRLARAPWVNARVNEIAQDFTDVLYVHTSMYFSPSAHDWRSWVCPMFLTPSYMASGERVPPDYTVAEGVALAHAHRVLTPSHLERRQLAEHYGVGDSQIRVVPRGIDRALFPPRVRSLDGPPLFCSVGSIKRQKNTLGLIRLFAALIDRYPGARLRVVGPIQDPAYSEEVYAEVTRLGLDKSIEFIGHVSPENLADSISDAHLHLSTSTCETFGRAIFETLAIGLPNVARFSGNAAAEFLEQTPYARFVDSMDEAVEATTALLSDLPRLSELATETGELYDDSLLAGLLAAEISESDIMVVADWDGTLFHKADPERTRRSVATFNGYARRVVCSARSHEDLREALAAHDVAADWVVASSGAVVADAQGRLLWRVPVQTEVRCDRLVLADDEVVQLAALHGDAPMLRVETYQGVRFATSWQASKLRAIVRLLREVDWRGRMQAFGDGPYDEEFLRYFDGTLVGERGVSLVRRAKEVSSV